MENTPTFEEIVAPYERALVLVAHPDDPEFFAGGTVARLVQAGIGVEYLILTCGDKGSRGAEFDALTGEELAAVRLAEQERAARTLGAAQVTCLGYPDGFLEPTYEVKRDTVRVVRRFKPDIIITTDPARLYSWGISHHDHRAAGLVALDVVHVGAGNARYFPELLAEGLPPHRVRELWICRGDEANLEVDVTSVFDQRIQALLHHRSQIGDPETFVRRMRERWGSQDGPIVERFRRLMFG